MTQSEQVRNAIVDRFVQQGRGSTVKDLAAWLSWSESKVRAFWRDVGGIDGVVEEVEHRENQGAYSNYVGGSHRVRVWYPTRAHLAELLKAARSSS